MSCRFVPVEAHIGPVTGGGADRKSECDQPGGDTCPGLPRAAEHEGHIPCLYVVCLFHRIIVILRNARINVYFALIATRYPWRWTCSKNISPAHERPAGCS